MFKGKPTTYIIIVLFGLIIAVSTLLFVTYSSLEKSKNKTAEQKQIILRNNYILKDVLYNIERLEEHEKEAKNNIKQYALLYRLSYNVFKNGGIIPEYTKGIILPEAPKVYWQKIKQGKEFMEGFVAITELIPEEPVFLYDVIYVPQKVNGGITEVKTIKKVKNSQLQKKIKELKIIIKELKELNHSFIEISDKRFQRFLNFQITAFVIALLLIFGATAGLLVILNKKVVQELNEFNENTLDIKKIFLDETQKKEKNYYLSPLFNRVSEFRTFLVTLNSFVVNLYNKNFETEPDSSIEQTPLYNTLNDLRKKLKQNEAHEAQRRANEKLRQWAVEGRNKIGSILQSAGTISELSETVIVGIVKYLNAAQGGIFLLKDKETDQSYLEMASAFAYDRKKFLKKTIPVGDGLLGMAALEQTTYWLKKIPEDYIEIESGLGDAVPKSLIIVPLKAENEMSGVMEIAAFEQFEQHEVDFIEEIAQNIGSSLRSVQIAEQTAKLLEESRKKSEELASQDTQMRDRFKELREAQKKARENELEMSAIVSVIDKSLLKCEVDNKGIIKTANRRFLTLVDYHAAEIKEKDFRILLEKEQQKDFEEKLNIVFEQEHILQFSARLKTKFDNHKWVLMQLAPVKNDSGEVVEAILVGNDVSHQKEIEKKNEQLLEETIEKADRLSEQEKEMQTNIKVLLKTQEELMKKEFELKAILSAMDLNNIIVEFLPDKSILNSNEQFKRVFKAQNFELQGVGIKSILKSKKNIVQIWDDVLEDENYSGVDEFNNFQGNSVWLMYSLSSVEDQNGKVEKVVMIAVDISEQKIAEKKISEQAMKLEAQEHDMEMNMSEMMEINSEIEKELEAYKQQEKKEIEEKANEAEKKYFDWIDDLIG
ncbi:MAG: PAS domain-containing protein [Bacteroidota bacterium]|nr:PAS domain-containing protein [Bacteroidota bacterium]